MKELLEYLARELVDNPDAVQVTVLVPSPAVIVTVLTVKTALIVWSALTLVNV